METSEAARTVRRGRASKVGCEMERTRLCVPSCFLQSFCCDVWSFVCVLNCLDSSVFVSCWPFLPSTFVSSPSSSPPPLSPLLLAHLSSHLLVLFSSSQQCFLLRRALRLLQILDTHTLSRRRDAVRQHIHFSCLFPFVRPFCRHSLYCPQILWLPPLIFIMFLPSLFLYSCLLSPCTPLPFSFILRPLIHFKAADKHVGFVPVLINRRKQNLH